MSTSVYRIMEIIGSSSGS